MTKNTFSQTLEGSSLLTLIEGGGGSGPTGPCGPQGPRALLGTNGTNGSVGPVGPQGPAGTNGTKRISNGVIYGPFGGPFLNGTFVHNGNNWAGPFT